MVQKRGCPYTSLPLVFESYHFLLWIKKKEDVLIILPFGIRKYTFSYGSKKRGCPCETPPSIKFKKYLFYNKLNCFLCICELHMYEIHS